MRYGTPALRRKRFLDQVNAAYATLRADARTWEAIESERRDWDVTLPDGLAIAEGRAPSPGRSRQQASRKRR